MDLGSEFKRRDFSGGSGYMSLNQSKSDKNESQNRKPGGGGRSGSSGQQRTFAGGSGKGGGGGFTAPPLVTNPPSQSAARSTKKTQNAQGLQPRVVAGSVNAAISAPVLNGSHSQSTQPAPSVTNKPNETATQRNTVPIPRGPSQSSAVKSDSTTKPINPAKGDGAKGYPLQFGSISPGFMNGMQVPARTTSAPPNIDELKRDQAQHAALKGAAVIPVASVPKPHVPRKDVVPVPVPAPAPAPQHITGETKNEIKVKRDAPVISAPAASQAQKPAVHPMTGISMQGPYSQPSIPMQFGGPNPQMQSQGMPASSLQMPMQMPLQMGNPSQVQQQQMFLQHPMMQPQGIMHQSQNIGFNPQMSQLSHQLGNPGMNLAPQYPQQQSANYSNTRKIVKITHPDTHEELRLDKKVDVPTDAASASRTHHNVQPPPYPSGHQMGYYAAVPPYFAAPSSSLPLGSAQLNPIPQQASRFTYPASQAQHAGPFASRAAPNAMPISKGGTVVHSTVESSNLDSFRVTHNVVSSSPASVTIKPAASSSTGKRVESKPVERGEAPRISRPAAEMSSTHYQKDSQINSVNNLALPKFGPEQLKPLSTSIHENVGNKTASSASAISHGNLSAAVNFDGRTEPVTRSEPVKESQKKMVDKGHDQLLPQFGLQASTCLSQDAKGSEDSQKMLSSLPGEAKRDISGAGAELATVQTHLEQSSAVGVASIDDGSCGADIAIESPACDASEIVGAGNALGTAVDHPAAPQDPPKAETSGVGKPGEKENIDGEKPKISTLDVDSVKQAEIVEKSNVDVELEENTSGAGLVDTSVRQVQSSTSSHAVGNKMETEISLSEQCINAVSDDGNDMKASDCTSGNEAVTEVHPSGHEGEASIGPVKAAEATSGTERLNMETARPSSSSGSVSSSDKGHVDSIKTKTTLARGKKKIKQILQKADAQGTTSDLYMAYKGPDEKKDGSSSVEQSDDISSTELKLIASELNQEDASRNDKDDESKAEPDDWEDAADASTPKLQSMSNKGRELTRQDGEEAEIAKKYSRDFLLTFSEHTSLPEGFTITADIADILTRPNSSSSLVGDREFPSPGRISDRPSSGHKVDRRGSGMMEADRWNKHPSPLPSPREMGPDMGYGPTSMGFRPGHGGNHGVLRNPRAQPPVQFPILSGPMHSMQRNNAEGDRWRSINIKGLMPPPQAYMHKAEKKYEIGKVTDEEQAKQRKLKGILNKLTPQNFDKLFAQVKEVNIDNVTTLTGVISQIFDKALMEPTFCEMYSNFCYELSVVLPELSVGEEKFTFKRLLLNKCQEEFERGEREEEEASSKAETVEEIKLSDAQREEIRLKARRRMLGNIRLIGELFKKRMLTERIMHACINTLLGQYPNSVEEDIESLCKLMSTIGEMIDRAKAKHQMDVYFDMMTNLSNNPELPSRVRFMLKDAIDLRKNKWQQRMKVEGPKKIEDVHRDAAQERHAQATRLNRGPSMGSGTRRGQPGDFGPRGSGMLFSPVGQTGSFRGMPHGRGYAMQDARMDDRNSFNSRNISVPLPHRPLGGDSITLGPQGGLARGMSIKGQPSVSAAPLADNSLSHGDNRRTTGGSNGFSSISDRGAFNSRNDSVHRYTTQERFGGSQLSTQDLPATSMNRDHKNVEQNLDRSIPASIPSRGQGVLTGQNMSSDKVWPEERLREKSIATIREFYSAKDENEVDMCVRELNAPKCYPSVISFWVIDSFDRKDLERDILNTLIVNLSKTRDRQPLFMPDQLIKGFEAVLTNLEDTVNDAPKAPDYLGRLFARLITENIVSLQAIGGLLYEGGEEPGRLLEEGLAGDVLGSILENIKAEKGDSAVKEVCAISKLRLEDFRPPDPLKSKKLELFI